MSETNTIELLPPGNYGVEDIVEADVNLMERGSDGLTVTLWLEKAITSGRGRDSMYVTVEDYKDRESTQTEITRLQVPEDHNPLDKDRGMFYHPLSY